MSPSLFSALNALLTKYVYSNDTELATITRGVLESTSGVVRSLIITGSTESIDLSQGDMFNLTLNSSVTLTLNNPNRTVYVFKIKQDSTGSRTITWPSSVKWAGGTAPTLTTTANAWDIVTLLWDGEYFSGTSTLNFVV